MDGAVVVLGVAIAIVFLVYFGSLLVYPDSPPIEIDDVPPAFRAEFMDDEEEPEGEESRSAS
jgi:hypothetical protein